MPSYSRITIILRCHTSGSRNNIDRWQPPGSSTSSPSTTANSSSTNSRTGRSSCGCAVSKSPTGADTSTGGPEPQTSTRQGSSQRTCSTTSGLGPSSVSPSPDRTSLRWRRISRPMREPRASRPTGTSPSSLSYRPMPFPTSPRTRSPTSIRRRSANSSIGGERIRSGSRRRKRPSFTRPASSRPS